MLMETNSAARFGGFEATCEEEIKVHGETLNQYDPDYKANTKNELTRSKSPQIKSGEVKGTEDLELPG